jgi:hypothetical protein
MLKYLETSGGAFVKKFCKVAGSNFGMFSKLTIGTWMLDGSTAFNVLDDLVDVWVVFSASILFW